MKKILVFIIAIITTMAIFVSCGNDEIINNNEKKNSATATPESTDDSTDTPESEEFEESEYFTKFDQNYIYDEAEATQIDLSKGTVTITEPGIYVLSGTLEDGQVIVSVDKEEKVKLVLNNADITCSYSSAIFVKSADKVSIILPEGTVNNVQDCKKYTSTDDGANACIYSKDDLSINGSGTLNVTALYNNGIGTKNDLRICGGNINISSANNAIKGNDSVAICGGNITITKCEDGIKTDSTDFQEGYIYISGGVFDLTCADDGLQASQDITVVGGTFTFNVEGKKANSKGTSSLGSFIVDD